MKIYCNICEKELHQDELLLNRYGEEVCPFCKDVDWDEISEPMPPDDPEPDYYPDGTMKPRRADMFEMADRIFESKNNR